MTRAGLRCVWPALAIALHGAAPAHAAGPLVRAQLVTKDTFLAGRQIEIEVDLLAPNYFMSAARFPQVSVPGAVATLGDDAQNFTETIDGTDFSGIRRIYRITPLAPGHYQLPPAPVTFSYAAQPGVATPGRATLPAVSFDVVAAPAAADGREPLVSTRVAITQSVDRDPAKLGAGDVLVRSLEATAEGLPAMLIPEPDLPAPDGVRVYRRDPVLSAVTEGRGETTAGKRLDQVTYRFDTAGTFELPAVAIAWYDPVNKRQRVAEAPAIPVTVAAQAMPASPLPLPAPEPVPAKARHPGAWGVAAAAVLAALAWAAVRLLPRLRQAAAAAAARRRGSEAAYFRRFVEACRSGTAAEIFRALDAWARRCRLGPLRAWAAAYGGRAASDQLERLEAELFGGGPAARQGPALAQAIGEARLRWLKAAEPPHRLSGIPLPPLNP